MIKVVAIDPGLHGHIVVMDLQKQVWFDIAIPTKGSEVDTLALLNLFQQMKTALPADRIIIELPQSRGGKTNLVAISNFGEIRACAKLAGLEFETVTGNVWCKHFRLNEGNKTQHIQVAQRLGYHIPPKSKRADSPPNDNYADALLIALWYLETNGGYTS